MSSGHCLYSLFLCAGFVKIIQVIVELCSNCYRETFTGKHSECLGEKFEEIGDYSYFKITQGISNTGAIVTNHITVVAPFSIPI